MQYQSCLIFCSAFVYCLSDFFVQIAHFCTFAFWEVLPRYHFRVFAISPCLILFLFVLWAFSMLPFSNGNLFCDVGAVFLLLLLNLVLAFFACFVLSLNQFEFPDFAYFLCYYIYLCILLLLWASAIATHPFFCHYSAPIIIPGHRNHPCQLTVFFCRDHACQNMSCSRICVSF